METPVFSADLQVELGEALAIRSLHESLLRKVQEHRRKDWEAKDDVVIGRWPDRKLPLGPYSRLSVHIPWKYNGSLFRDRSTRESRLPLHVFQPQIPLLAKTLRVLGTL
jgi:hypothetical protein